MLIQDLPIEMKLIDFHSKLMEKKSDWKIEE